MGWPSADQGTQEGQWGEGPPAPLGLGKREAPVRNLKGFPGAAATDTTGCVAQAADLHFLPALEAGRLR